MGVFDNMKAKLGFGAQPEWQDDGYQGYDDQGYDEYADQAYDDGYGQATQAQNDLLSFDSYNPDNFAHVTLSTDRDLKVAPLDSAPGESYVARRSSYSSNIGTSSSRYDSNVRSFGRSSGTSDFASDAASFVSSITSRRNKPEEHVEIVKATAYADVEHVATAARTGKVVALVLTNTRPELAKRILDFSFGVASALNGTVDKAADKVFIISRDSVGLTDEESAYLRDQGII